MNSKNGEDEEVYAGIILTMKKRMVIIDRDDTDQSQYTMFGHYDGMDIQNLGKWYEMRPKRVGIYNGNTSIADSYSDKHTLKGYFPRKDTSEELKKSGIYYDFWKKVGSERAADSGDSILNDVPFITVSVINLSGEFVEHTQDGKELILTLGKKLAEVAEKNDISLENIHCAVIPSIGYADFIILFHSNDLTQNIKILDGLKGCSMTDHAGHSYAVISNSYSISGVFPGGIEQLKNHEDSQVKVSVRIILKEGISAGDFRVRFEQELKQKLKETYPGESTAVECFRLFGNSDCMILSDMPVELFMPLYFKDGFLNPSSKFFGTYIKSLYSSLITPVTEHGEWSGEQTECGTDGDDFGKKSYKIRQEQFQSFISELEGFCEKNKCPIRLSIGLQTVMKTFLNFIQSSHCFDIHTVIGNAFDVLCDVALKDMKEIKGIDKNISDLESKGAVTSAECMEKVKGEIEDLKQHRCHLLNNMILSLGIFRERIGDYLIDLQRSDSSFMEGQSLSHPSIGSATKLLFFYNHFINDIAKKLVETEELHAYEDTYTFVVTSGGCDKARSCDIFSHRDPSACGNRSLIILTIPEMSLYDVRGTLFRILHEVLHFCGKRLRKQRAKHFMRAICLYIGDVFGERQYYSMWEEGMEFYETISHIAASRLSSEDAANMEIKIKAVLKKHCDDIKNDTVEYLMKQPAIDAYMSPDVPYEILYGTFLSEDTREILFDLLIPQVGCTVMKKNDRVFASWLYKDIFRHYKEILDELLAEFERAGIQYSQLNIANQKAEYYLRNCQRGIFDKKSYRFIQAVLHKFLGNRIFLDDGQEYVRKDIFSYDEIGDSILVAIQELYSDCIAVTLLGMEIEDFLLAFVYEMWDIQQAFPETLLNVMRVGVEMKVLFGVDKNLSEEQRTKIINKCKYWEKRGFEYKLDASELCDQVDELMKVYREQHFEYFMKPVETYIEECIKLFEHKDFSSVRTLYALTDIENDTALYDMLDSIILQWKLLAAPGNADVKE